jgi:hypothetical protein
MLEYRPGWDQALYGGYLTHHLVRNDQGVRMKLKRVDLINCDAAFPALAVPF